MNKRYQKVLMLYTLSTLIPYTVLKKYKNQSLLKSWLPSTLLGYSIFAYGLKALTTRKHAKRN